VRLWSMAPLFIKNTHEKQQNAASPNLWHGSENWWVLLSKITFFCFTKHWYVWLRVNLTRSGSPIARLPNRHHAVIYLTRDRQLYQTPASRQRTRYESESWAYKGFFTSEHVFSLFKKLAKWLFQKEVVIVSKLQ